MRGIRLLDSIELFGFKDAFGFWFRWSFIDPIQMVWWKLINKSYCTYCGYHCREGCNAKKLYTRKEIKEQLNKKPCPAELQIEGGGFCWCELEEGHLGNHRGAMFEWEEMKGFADNSYKFRANNLMKIHMQKILEKYENQDEPKR